MKKSINNILIEETETHQRNKKGAAKQNSFFIFTPFYSSAPSEVHKLLSEQSFCPSNYPPSKFR